MVIPVQRVPGILRLPQVRDRTGLSRSGIYKKMADGEFPQSISLGLRARGWVDLAIEKWIQDRIELSERQGAQS